tara:strand:+ start:560 stop:760 length:201 start_codon:yes stop_codon:yes gene_type:complete
MEEALEEGVDKTLLPQEPQGLLIKLQHHQHHLLLHTLLGVEEEEIKVFMEVTFTYIFVKLLQDREL